MSGEHDRVYGRTIQVGACLVYLGPTAGAGYGVVSLGRKRNQDYAHRLAYSLTNGPVPDGCEVNHLCRVRLCVNPEHVEAVTHVENVRWSMTTHCQNGHLYDAANTHILRGGARRCRACDRDRHRAAWARKKENAA